jgi:hypothetical protein
MTKQLDKWLIEGARNLNDGKLMAVLSGGDVAAQELKNHYFCLTALYNKVVFLVLSSLVLLYNNLQF